MTARTTARRATKVVATLGPSTDDERVLDAMVAAGMDVARLNFSHGTQAEQGARIEAVRRAAARHGRVVGIMADLQGPRMRIGRLEGGGPVRLNDGVDVHITTQAVAGTAARLSTEYAGLPRDVRPGDRLLLDDGRVELRVREVTGDEARCEVVRGGELRERAGIVAPGVVMSAPPVTEKDEADLRFALGQGVDLVALSFVRHPADADTLRRVMRDAGREVPAIAKVERTEAVESLDGVVRAFDGVMVARGDLGVELPPERVPGLQKRIIRTAIARGRASITATQMLESMTHAARPTRAEASDVANAVVDGTDAVMLSGETAVGDHPALVVEAMARIVVEGEMISAAPPPEAVDGPTQAEAVCRSAVALAASIDAAAIAAYTATGGTARTLAALRPAAPIIALCADEATARALTLWRGVAPVVTPGLADGLALIERMTAALGERSLVAPGRRVVVVGSAPGARPHETNFVRVVEVER